MPRGSSLLASRLQQLRSQIDSDIEVSLGKFLQDCGVSSTSLGQGASDSTRGGKRFRGLGAYVGAALALSHNGAEEDSADELLLAAAKVPGIGALSCSLEFYQASALIHDDIIDRADTRRGAPSAQVALGEQHADQAMVGDSEHYGISGAILLGDLLLAAADSQLAAVGDSADAASQKRVLKRYSLMAGEVAGGQFRDLTASHLPLGHTLDPNRDPIQDAEAVVQAKSARYSVVHPILLGAALVGTDSDFLEALESVLEPAGVAFQLRDDDLGAFSTSTATGKSAGIDVEQRKHTVLLALAWSHSSVDERRLLARVYGAPNPDQSHVEQAASILLSRGRPAHEEKIGTLSAQASSMLQQMRLTEGSEELLGHFLGMLTTRSS